jgi:hypothetical protein
MARPVAISVGTIRAEGVPSLRVFCKGGQGCCVRYLIFSYGVNKPRLDVGISDARPSHSTRRTGHPPYVLCQRFKRLGHPPCTKLKMMTRATAEARCRMDEAHMANLLKIVFVVYTMGQPLLRSG